MSKFVNVIVLGGFFVFGIILVISAGRNDESGKDFNEHAETVTAYVNRVDKTTTQHRSNSGKGYTTRTNYTAYVSYEVDGVQYSDVKITKGASKLTEGTSVILYYHKYRPSWIQVDKYSASEGTAMRVIGYILCGISVLLILNELGLKNKIRSRRRIN